jgi:hypothetical protein
MECDDRCCPLCSRRSRCTGVRSSDSSLGGAVAWFRAQRTVVVVNDLHSQLSKWTLDITAAPSLDAARAVQHELALGDETVPSLDLVSYGDLVCVLSAFHEMLAVEEKQIAEEILSFCAPQSRGSVWVHPPHDDNVLYLLVNTQQFRKLMRQALLRADNAQPASPDILQQDVATNRPAILRSLRRALDFLDELGPADGTVVLELVWGW